MSGRISRDELFMTVAETFAERSTCLRGQVGAVIILDNHIVAHGYNGAPANLPHCTEVGCAVSPDHLELGCQRAIHAEANAIAWAAKQGMGTEGARMFSTASPCVKCAELIIQAGIVEVVWQYEYRIPDGLLLLDRAAIMTRQFVRDLEG